MVLFKLAVAAGDPLFQDPPLSPFGIFIVIISQVNFFLDAQYRSDKIFGAQALSHLRGSLRRQRNNCVYKKF